VSDDNNDEEEDEKENNVVQEYNMHITAEIDDAPNGFILHMPIMIVLSLKTRLLMNFKMKNGLMQAL